MLADAPIDQRPSRLPDWAILVAFCVAFSLQVVLTITRESATFDEPANLGSGYVELTRGDDWLLPQNLPFVKRLASLPLLFVDVKVPPPPYSSPLYGNEARLFGQRLLYEVNDGDRLLLLGRLAVLPLALLLGSLLFLWAKQLFGRAAALLALALYTFEPNILAHSGLVTSDLAVACLMFAVIYGFKLLTQRVTLPRLLLPAVACGVALVTKFTLLLLVFILLLLGLLVSFSRQVLDFNIIGIPRRSVTSPAGKLLALLPVFLLWGLVAFVIVWATYGFSYERFSAERIAEAKPWNLVPLSQFFFLQKAILSARQVKLLPGAYLNGFNWLLARSGRNRAYLLGQVRPGGWWYFFLVTFLIKTPVALLILIGLALWVQRRRWREDPLQTAFLLVPVVVYFTIISAVGWNIGHRHLLPIYPFLFVVVSSLIPWAIQRRPLAKAGLAGLGAWYLAASLSIFPHYLAYFNELVGGPNQGYKYLVDSNLDWGQDLKNLKRYMEDSHISRVWLSYFGTARPEYYAIAYNPLPSFAPLDRRGDTYPTPYVAISATNLQGVYVRGLSPDWDLFKEFRTRQPIAKIGYSIFVYRLE